MRFWPSGPPFSGISSTKSRFLCFFGLQNPHFRAFLAQNRGFCALLGSGTSVFGHSEHKIEVFVRFWPSEPSFSGFSSTKSRFLCSFTKLDVGLGDFPAERGIVAPAEPLHLRCRCTSAAYTTADATAASLAEPLHLRSRCTCAAVVSAQPSYLRSRCAICRRL